MDDIWIQIFIVLALILLNGLFSMSEMAVVSARKTRLQQKAEDGDPDAQMALKLAENPNRFLSTVQVGITLIGILSGAFGGATIAENLAAYLSLNPAIAPYAEGISVGLVVLTITYLSLVLGELVPKRLALNNAEKVAVNVAWLMNTLSIITTPIVRLLSFSTEVTLKLLRAKPSEEPAVTQEDLRDMLDQGTQEGVFQEAEQDMVERVFRMSARPISTLMTPRTEIIFIEHDASQDEILERIHQHPYSRFPVIRETSDNILGLVHARDLLLQRVTGASFDLQAALQAPLYVPETTPTLAALEQFKRAGAEIAVVIDEYGGVLGLVSLNDVLEAIVGDMTPESNQSEAEAIQREDGSWLFDGMILADDLKATLDMDELPEEEDRKYETLSGLMMSELGRIPCSGDHFQWQAYRFEVVDMDGRKVDKVLVTRIPEQKEE